MNWRSIGPRSHLSRSHSPQESPLGCHPPLTSYAPWEKTISATSLQHYLSSFSYSAQHIHLTFRAFLYSPPQKSLICSICSALINRRMHWTQWELGKSKARCLHSPFQKIFLVSEQWRAMCRNSAPTCDLARSLPGLHTESSTSSDLSPFSYSFFCTMPLQSPQNALFHIAATTLYPPPDFHCWYVLEIKARRGSRLWKQENMQTAVSSRDVV